MTSIDFILLIDGRRFFLKGEREVREIGEREVTRDAVFHPRPAVRILAHPAPFSASFVWARRFSAARPGAAENSLTERIRIRLQPKARPIEPTPHRTNPKTY
jgi:hypothetical protein